MSIHKLAEAATIWMNSAFLHSFHLSENDPLRKDIVKARELLRQLRAQLAAEEMANDAQRRGEYE